jgi:hypothetical protein
MVDVFLYVYQIRTRKNVLGIGDVVNDGRGKSN